MSTVTGTNNDVINAAVSVANAHAFITNAEQSATAQSIVNDLAAIRDSTTAGLPYRVPRDGDTGLTGNYTTTGDIQGANVTATGDLTSSDYHLYSTPKTIIRRKLNIMTSTYSAAPPGSPDMWTEEQGGGSNAPVIRTRDASAAGNSGVIEVAVIDGATLTNVKLDTKGVAGSGTANLPSYQLIRWKGSTAPTNVSGSTADAHSAGNFTSTELTTTITPTSTPHTIDAEYHYGVVVTHPWDGGSSAAVYIYDCYTTMSVSRSAV